MCVHSLWGVVGGAMEKRDGVDVVFEHIGPTGIMTQTQILLPFLRRIQSGKLYHYAFAFVVAATFFLACVLAGPQGLFTHLFTAYDPRWIILFMVCSVRSV